LWILFGASLLVGTLSDERVISLPRQEGGWWILASDLHVHSFFGDGALPPWDLRREAERRGLDAFVITNHNQVATSLIGPWLTARSAGPLVVPGEEVTAPNYHLTAVGVRRLVDWRPPLLDVIEAIHAAGGAAIAAHPAEPGLAAFTDPVLRRLDGIEGVPSSMEVDTPMGRQLHELFERARRANPHIAYIGGSDFHFVGPIGAYRTYLFARERTEAGVVDAIRAGRTVSCDPRGRVDGAEQLQPMVSHDCAAAAGGLHGPGPWAIAARLCAWSALLAMIVVAGTAHEEEESPESGRSEVGQVGG
jgi:predicted metal-dependent phosphoesterase TrpH